MATAKANVVNLDALIPRADLSTGINSDNVKGLTLTSLEPGMTRRVQQRERKFDPECLRRFEIEGQLDSCGLLNRQIGWLIAVENAPGIDSKFVQGIDDAGAIAHQAAAQRVLTVLEDRGQRMAGRQRHERFGAPGVEGTVAD